MLIIDARKVYDAGIGTYLRQLVPRVLQRLRDVDVTLWIPAGGERWLAEIQRAAGSRVTGHVLPARPLSVSEQPVLRRALRGDALLWATSLSHPLFYRGPLVATVHDVAQLALPAQLAGGRITQLATRVFLHSLRRSADELMFVSEFSRGEFARRVGAPRQGVTVTPLAADAGWFAARGQGERPQAEPYFISVSSVRPHKNLGFLVRAFAAVADRVPQQLVIVGESQGLRTVDASLPALVDSLKGRVHFLGRLEDAELRRWVAHADAMVFPSLYEGFGLPPLEAMAAGCPVLSSTAGALQEVCADAARYFDPRDASSLQQGLLAQAAVSAAEREAQIARGLARARSHDWERTADLSAGVLQRALARLPQGGVQ